MKIPTYSETQTKNQLPSQTYGYTLAHTYIEYLDVTYGWESVLNIIKTNDYEKSFEKTQKIYI